MTIRIGKLGRLVGAVGGGLAGLGIGGPIGAAAGAGIGAGIGPSILGEDVFAPTAGSTQFAAFHPGMGTAGIELPKDISPLVFTPPAGDHPYQAKDFAGPLPEYDSARNQFQNQANAQYQTGLDAINRRFTAMGGGPSGSQIAAQLQYENQYQQNRNQGLNQIGFQEAQTRRGLQQGEAAKEFQSGEAYNARSREMAFQNALFNKQLEMQNAQSHFEGATKLRSLDLAYWQALNDEVNSNFNKELAQYQAAHSGGLLGGGGILGTGIRFG